MDAVEHLNAQAAKAILREKHKRNRLFIENAIAQMATDFGAKEAARITREMLEELES